MGSSGKCNKRCVEHLKDRPKLSFLVYGPGHSSIKYKVISIFMKNIQSRGQRKKVNIHIIERSIIE